MPPTALLSMMFVLALGGRASAQSTTTADSLVPKLVTDTASMRSLRDARQRFARAFGVESVRRMTTRFTSNADVSVNSTFLEVERFAEWQAILRVSRSRWTMYSSSITGLDTMEDIGDYEFSSGTSTFNGSYRITWLLDRAGQWQIRQLKMLPA